ncbi:MAG: thioredoxin family protein [bacterium]|nr:thioredoxin family protein [bacterium]
MNTQKGISQIMLLSLIGALVVIGVGFYYFSSDTKDLAPNGCTAEGKVCFDGTIVGRVGSTCEFEACPADDAAMKEDGDTTMEVPASGHKEVDEMIELGDSMTHDDEGSMMMEEDGDVMMTSYSGMRFAGSEKAPLLDFNQEDYNKAISSGNLVVLYFYANWCPICRAEFPKMEQAFDELGKDGVVGFRVNYNDNETNGFEETLAREFGVAYQHTKVFLRDGKVLQKAPDGWDKDRYISEINKAL